MTIATEKAGTGLTGTYLTDGDDLYCVGERIGDADLWEVEDCRTLGVLLLSGQELRDGSLRPVRRHAVGTPRRVAELQPAPA